jgi:hypothetical protein
VPKEEAKVEENLPEKEVKTPTLVLDGLDNQKNISIIPASQFENHLLVIEGFMRKTGCSLVQTVHMVTSIMGESCQEFVDKLNELKISDLNMDVK